MDLILRILFILTYTDAPSEDGTFGPSLLLRMIGGWDDIEAVNDAAVLPPERVPAGPCKAVEKLQMALAANPEDEGNDFTRLRSMNRKGEKWDQEFVVRMMKRYERSFELLDEMMTEPEIRFDYLLEVTSVPNVRWRILDFPRVYSLRVRMFQEAGAWSEALDSLSDLNRYANFVMKSPGPLVHALMGSACEMTMLSAAERLLDDPRLPPAKMIQLREILEEGPDRGELRSRIWKHEYLYQKETTRAVAKGLTAAPMELGLLFSGGEPNVIDEIRSAVSRCVQQAGLAVAFQPNRSTQLAADMMADAIERSRLSFAERHKAKLPAAFREGGSWRDYLHSNGFGEYILRNALGHTLKALDRFDHVESYRQVLLANWGIRRYHQLYGRLPGTLRVLVPEILTGVPRDRYDGGRVKYSAQKQQLWVVGADLRDDGGTYDESWRSFQPDRPFAAGKDGGYDPTLKIKWLISEQIPRR